MAIAQLYSISNVTVGTTELSIVSGTTTLQNDATDGYFELIVDDRANMAKGDEFQITVYEKCLTGGTKKVLFRTSIADVQSELFAFPGRILMHGWDMTLKKIAGTDRAFDASIRQVA